MVQQQKPPEVRSTRSKVMVILRAAGWGALLYEARYLRQMLIMFASLPMGLLALIPPDTAIGMTYHPDVGDWVCRIVFFGLTIAVNIVVALPDFLSRFRRHTLRLYCVAILVILVGTPLSYAMRLVFINSL